MAETLPFRPPDFNEYFGQEASELEWGEEMKLVGGTVLLISHTENTRIYIFESTSYLDNKRAEGWLTSIMEGQVVDERLCVTANLSHPITDSTARYIEFIHAQEDASVRIMPPLGLVHSIFSDALAEAAQRAKSQEVAPAAAAAL